MSDKKDSNPSHHDKGKPFEKGSNSGKLNENKIPDFNFTPKPPPPPPPSPKSEGESGGKSGGAK